MPRRRVCVICIVLEKYQWMCESSTLRVRNNMRISFEMHVNKIIRIGQVYAYHYCSEEHKKAIFDLRKLNIKKHRETLWELKDKVDRAEKQTCETLQDFVTAVYYHGKDSAQASARRNDHSHAERVLAQRKRRYEEAIKDKRTPDKHFRYEEVAQVLDLPDIFTDPEKQELFSQREKAFSLKQAEDKRITDVLMENALKFKKQRESEALSRIEEHNPYGDLDSGDPL